MTDQTTSLYERLGGESEIIRLVDLFYEKVLADEEIGGYFSDIPMPRLKNMQKEFFSIALGGPSDYSDINLRHAHHGKGIRTGHFKIFVDILFDTLAALELSEDERYEIISQVNTYVDDIVDDVESLVD